MERDDTQEKLTRFRPEALLPGTPTPQDWRYALRPEGFLDHDPSTPRPAPSSASPSWRRKAPPSARAPSAYS